MKVINLAKALSIYQQEGVSTAEALNRITDNHLFEVDLAEACKWYNLKRVIRVLDHGDIAADVPCSAALAFPLSYSNVPIVTLIPFWIAENEASPGIWRRCTRSPSGLKSCAPSEDCAPGSEAVERGPFSATAVTPSKLSTWGAPVKRDRPSRNDNASFPCQPVNSPPELLYGHSPTTGLQRQLRRRRLYAGEPRIFHVFRRFNDIRPTA